MALLLGLAAAGCGDSTGEGDSGRSDDRGDHGEKPTCELRSVTDLADENELAPNGQTGAEIVSAVPASVQTTLLWDFASATSGTEVEVPKATGVTVALELTFTWPAQPRFAFEDWELVEPSGDSIVDVDVVCEDYVTTVLDVELATADGAIAVSLTGVTVRLGPDRAELDELARPYSSETVAMPSLRVDFVEPVSEPASSDKTLDLVFGEDGSVEGAIVVYAQTGTETYEHAVARW